MVPTDLAGTEFTALPNLETPGGIRRPPHRAEGANGEGARDDSPPVEAAHPHTGRDLMPGRASPKQFAILALTVCAPRWCRLPQPLDPVISWALSHGHWQAAGMTELYAVANDRSSPAG
jgi:hypothetical protein